MSSQQKTCIKYKIKDGHQEYVRQTKVDGFGKLNLRTLVNLQLNFLFFEMSKLFRHYNYILIIRWHPVFFFEEEYCNYYILTH